MNSDIERPDSENSFHFMIEKLIKIAPVATPIIALLSLVAYVIVNRAQFLNLGFNWQNLFICSIAILWLYFLFICFRRILTKWIFIPYFLLFIVAPIMLSFLTFIPNGKLNKFVVLVSKFDGPNPENYRITENILDSLREATKKYPEVQIDTLDEIVTSLKGSAYARKKGKEHKPPACIVIWGSLATPKDIAQISYNFEMLGKPRYFKIEHEGKGINEPLVRLESFQIQAELSLDFSFLTLFVVGLLKYEYDDFSGAIDLFTRAMDYSPVKSFVYYRDVVFFYRGLAFQLNRNIEKAIADYNIAIELNPRFAVAYINRGSVYQDKGDFDRAITDYDRAIELNPKFSEAYYNRGIAYRKKGNLEKAIADYDIVIELNPNDAEAYNNRGIAYRNRGDLRRANEDFKKAKSLDPNLNIPSLPDSAQDSK